jgi:hypothetical protein
VNSYCGPHCVTIFVLELDSLTLFVDGVRSTMFFPGVRLVGAVVVPNWFRNCRIM